MIKDIFKKRNVIAVDFGFSALKGIKMHRGKHPKLQGCGIFPLKTDTENPYENFDSVMPALVSLRDSLDAKGKKVRININLSFITVRELKVPVVPEEELEEIVKWELRKVIDFDEYVHNLDFAVLDKIDTEGVSKFVVKVYVAKKDLLRRFVSAVEAAGMGVELITIPPYCHKALFEHFYDNSEGNYAIVDIGLRAATLTILVNGKIRFERQLRFSGFELIDLLNEYGIEADVEDLAMLYRGYRFGDGSDLDKPTMNAFDVLINDLTASFNYFNSVIKGGSIGEIYITGGLGNIKGVDEFVGKNLNIKAGILDPFKAVTCSAPGLDPYRLGVAIGLGLL